MRWLSLLTLILLPLTASAEPLLGHYPGGHPYDHIATSDSVRDALEPTGARLGYIGDFVDLERGDFNGVRASLDAVWNTGAVYVLNLMSMTPLRPIAFPANAAEWARSNRYYALASTIKDWGDHCDSPLCYMYIIPFPEMNMPWVPYGQTPGDFIEAFGRLRYVLWQVGALKYVRMVWAPTVAEVTNLAQYYPGAWADAVGCSAYYDMAHVHWCIDAMRTVAPGKKVLIAQTGACQPVGSWLTDLVLYLRQQPDSLGFLWFEYDKECNFVLTAKQWRRAGVLLDPRTK